MGNFLKKPLPVFLTEAAEMSLAAGLAVLLFHSKIFACFSAAPLIYSFFRFGKTGAFIITIFATALTAFFESQTLRILFLLVSPLPTLIFCAVHSLLALLGKSKSITPLFLISIAFLTLCYSAGWFYVSKGEPYPYLHSAMTDGLRTIPAWLEKNGEIVENLKKMNPPQTELWLSGLKQISDNAPNIAETFIQEKLFGYAIGALIILFWLFSMILNSLGKPVTSTDLTRWKVPDHLVWLAIVSYLFRGISVPFFSPLFKNTFIVLEVLYFLHGLSIVAFFFKSRQISSIQRNFFYVPFFLFPMMTAAIGFFDLWIDFRSKIEKIQKKSVLDRNNIKGGA